MNLCNRCNKERHVLGHCNTPGCGSPEFRIEKEHNNDGEEKGDTPKSRP